MVAGVFGTVSEAIVVVGWVFDVNENEPVLPSGNDHVTVHFPFPKVCVSAADTVTPSVAN